MTVLTVQILLIVFFLSSALFKLMGQAHMRKEFARFGYPYWLARLAGVIELVASAALVAGYRQPAWLAIAAFLLVPVMIGATWTNFVKRPPAFGWGTLAILLACVFLAAEGYRGAESRGCIGSPVALRHCLEGTP